MNMSTCDPNEDHEKYMGEVIKDPWDDPTQTDWPDNPTKEEGDDGSTDEEPGQAPG